jgi:hypothetical protein
MFFIRQAGVCFVNDLIHTNANILRLIGLRHAYLIETSGTHHGPVIEPKDNLQKADHGQTTGPKPDCTKDLPFVLRLKYSSLSFDADSILRNEA